MRKSQNRQQPPEKTNPRVISINHQRQLSQRAVGQQVTEFLKQGWFDTTPHAVHLPSSSNQLDKGQVPQMRGMKHGERPVQLKGDARGQIQSKLLKKKGLQLQFDNATYRTEDGHLLKERNTADNQNPSSRNNNEGLSLSHRRVFANRKTQDFPRGDESSVAQARGQTLSTLVGEEEGIKSSTVMQDKQTIEDFAQLQERSKSIFNSSILTEGQPSTTKQVKEGQKLFNGSINEKSEYNSKYSKQTKHRYQNSMIGDAEKSRNNLTTDSHRAPLPPLCLSKSLKIDARMQSNILKGKLDTLRTITTNGEGTRGVDPSLLLSNSSSKPLPLLNFKRVDQLQEFEQRFSQRVNRKKLSPFSRVTPIISHEILSKEITPSIGQLLSPIDGTNSIESSIRQSISKNSSVQIQFQAKNRLGGSRYCGLLDMEPIFKISDKDEDQDHHLQASENIDELLGSPEYKDVYKRDLEYASQFDKGPSKILSPETRRRVLEMIKVIDSKIDTMNDQIGAGLKGPSLEVELDSDVYGSEDSVSNDENGQAHGHGYSSTHAHQSVLGEDLVSASVATKPPKRKESKAKVTGNRQRASTKRLTTPQQQGRRRFKALKQTKRALLEQLSSLNSTAVHSSNTKNDYSQQIIDPLSLMMNQDPQFREEINSLNPKTRDFLGDVIKDNQLRYDKLRKIKQAKYAIEMRRREMKQIRDQLRTSRKGVAADAKGEDGSLLVSEVTTVIQNKQLSDSLELKFSSGQASLVELSGVSSPMKRKLLQGTKDNAHEKNVRLRNFVRDKVIPLLHRKCDWAILTRVVRFKDVLQEFLGSAENTGQRYASDALNLWQNQAMQELTSHIESLVQNGKISKEQDLYFKKVYSIDMQQSESKQDHLLANLINEFGHKMDYYDQIRERFKHQIEAIPEEEKEDEEGLGRADSEQYLQWKKKQEALVRASTEKLARVAYYKKCEKTCKGEPTFVKIKNNTLYLSQFRITDQMANALKEYLIDTKELPDTHIQKLVLDDCGLKDRHFAAILEGILAQQDYGKIQTIIYSSGEYGDKSHAVLVQLVSSLRELQLENVTKADSKLFYRELLDELLERSIVLQKLKLAHVNLQDDYIVDSICNLITQKVTLTHLDLSWAKLAPKHLNTIAQTLFVCPNRIRNLNLSYNTLSIDASPQEHEMSMTFIFNLVQYLKATTVLNHLNLSGLGLKHKQLKLICKSASECSNLQAIHLNDNLIMENLSNAAKILNIFGVKQKYDPKSETLVDSGMNVCQHQLTQKDNKLLKVIKQASKHVQARTVLDESKGVEPNAYKDHYILANRVKSLQNDKLQNPTTSISSLHSHNLDHFVMTRQVNHPELIFNQSSAVPGYFDGLASSRWTMSTKNECFDCQKHKYVAISYDQSLDLRDNADLRQITDKGTLSKIKAWLNLKVVDTDRTTPYICGSFINGGFTRKQRMLRMDLYAFLLLTNSADLVESRQRQIGLRKGLLALANYNQNFSFDCLTALLRGYQRILKDFWYKNQINDILLINPPSETQNYSSSMQIQKDNCERFVYADYVPPGVHHFLIYCPKTHRAFVKEVAVSLNQMSMAYPELPPQLGSNQVKQRKRVFHNVWSKYRYDNAELLLKCANLDLKNNKVQPRAFLKSVQDVENCLKIIEDKYQLINIAFKEFQRCSIRDASFPQVSSHAFFTLFTKINDKLASSEKINLERSGIEPQYITATRQDRQTGLRGALSRGEFTNLLLRICHASCAGSKSKSKNEPVADHLEDFLDSLLVNLASKSPIQQRAMIHADKRVNKLLYINREGLKIIMNDYKHPITVDYGFMLSRISGLTKQKYFTIHSARKMVRSTGKTDDKFIDQMEGEFVYCQQTIENENTCEFDYQWLSKVEFLEFIVRLALNYHSNQTDIPLEQKVLKILQILWEIKQKQSKQSDSVQFPELEELESEYEDDEDDADENQQGKGDKQ